MDSGSLSARILRKWWWFLLAVAPVLLWAGNKPSAPQHSAPQAHSAPAQHPNLGGGSHTNTNMNRGNTNVNRGNTNMNRGNTNVNRGNTNMNRGNTNTMNRGSTNTNRGNTNTMNRGNTNTNRGNTNTMNRGNNMNRGNVHNAGTHGAPQNFHPHGTETHMAGGRTSIHDAHGRTYVTGRNGHVEHFAGHSGSANFRGNGHFRDVHARGMDVHYGLHGGRVYSGHFHDGGRYVGWGHGHGFVEHPMMWHGHAYVTRTYYWGGHPYAFAYRTYYWGGAPYYWYASPFYYHPAFYAWAWNPWPAPVYYPIGYWGWGGYPWYGYYGYYFAPAPVYPVASLWLADYLLAANLANSYQAQQDAMADANAGDSDAAPADNGNTSSNGQVQLSPEVKQAIADEVKRQLAAEQTASKAPGSAVPASDPSAPPALDPNNRVFVVSSQLDVSTDDGQECSLTPGDVVSRIDDSADSNKAVRVSILSSKKGDCSGGAMPRVQVADLQEMHNQFDQQVDAGTQALAKKQGQNGLPKAPDTGTVNGDAPQAQPDANAASELNDQQSQADQAAQDVQQEAFSDNGNSGGGNH